MFLKFRYYNRSLISKFFYGINNYDAIARIKAWKKSFLCNLSYEKSDLNNWKSPGNDFFGVFDKNTCRLLGWALLSKYGDHIDFSMLKIEQDAVKKRGKCGIDL